MSQDIQQTPRKQSQAPKTQPGQKKANKASPKKAAKNNAQRPKAGKPTGGQPTANQKRAIMEGKRTKTRGATDKQQKLGLNFWESIPYTLEKLSVATPYAQYAARRVARNIAVNSYVAEVYPSVQAWSHWAEILRCIETLIDRSYEGIDATYSEAEQQIEHLWTTLALEEDDEPEYINVQTITLAVTTPRVRQVLRLVKRLDHMVMRMDALWMAEGGISNNYLRHEAMRLRSALLRHIGTIFHQSDRVRRVMNNHLTPKDLLAELKDDLDQHYGKGLKESDAEGNNMLIEGEGDLKGPLAGEEPEAEDAVEG